MSETVTIAADSSTLYDVTGQVQLTEHLKSQQLHQEEVIQERTVELQERGRQLQENQQALMNIVDDLNQKTEELEQANTKLHELDQLKSMFIASMSHELRTPLNSIIGFSSIIRDEWIGPINTEQKENLDTIQRSGKHLLSLINDVIDVSKIEAGRIETRFEEFDLYDLLTEAVQYLEKDIHEKGLELHLNIHHHPLFTDKRRLLQCVINLLSNAVKFTKCGGVTLSSVVTDTGNAAAGKRFSGTRVPMIGISIEDSGIGIAEEDITRLFEAFVRLESPLKATAPGTGLGLYLTRKLVVDVLGGDILCKSVAGMGSTFTLIIPERIYEKGTGSRG
jgi:signal transduction histidine kinase